MSKSFFEKFLSSKSRRKSSTRSARRDSVRLGVESLEARQLLAVNVVADVFDIRQGDGATRFDVLANDQISPDHAGAFVVTSISAGSEGGQIQIIEDGKAISYLPPAHLNGPETFTYSVDGDDSGMLTFHVASPLRDDVYTIEAGSGVQTLDVLANDPFWTDYVGERNITLVGRSPLGADIEISADGSSLIYTPAQHAYGTDTIDYIVDGVHAASIEIVLPNPTERDEFHLLQNDGPTTFNLLANDPEIGLGSRISHILDVPEGSTATISDDGRSIVFTPEQDFAGYVSMRYVVDSQFEQHVSIRVISPVVNDYVSVDVNGQNATLNVLDNDDYHVGLQTFDIVDRITSVSETDEGGVVTISNDGRTLTYTPPADFEGTDRFTYTAEGLYPAQVTVSVTPPVRDDSFTAYLGDVNVPLDVLANDFIGDGYDGDRLITSLDTSESRGAFAIRPDGKGLLYTPPADNRRIDSVIYEVDGEFTARVHLNYRSPVSGASVTIQNMESQVVAVLADADFGPHYAGAGLITSVTQPDNGGQVTISANQRHLNVIPGIGQTRFTYTVDNNELLTGDVVLSPEAWLVSDQVVVDQNGGARVNVFANDFENSPDRYFRLPSYAGDRVITAVTNGSSGATVTISADGNWVDYSAPADFVGADSFTYIVDGFLEQTVTVDVVRRVEDDVFRVDLGSVNNTLPVMLNDLLGADYRGASHITSVTAADAEATVSIGADNQALIYTPSANSDGTDTLTYTVDGQLVATVEIFVRAADAVAHEQFGSLEALGEFALSSAIERYYGENGYNYYYDDQFFTLDAAFDRGESVPFSDTNTQVAGVDEADVVENDGQYLYTLAGSELVITHVASGTELAVVSQTPLEGVPVGIYLNGDRLTVISTVRDDGNVVQANGSVTVDGFQDGSTVNSDSLFPRYFSQDTLAAVYDVSDQAAPVLAHATRFDGTYVESRRIDDTVFVITDPGSISLPSPTYDENGELETEAEYSIRMREQMASLLPETLPSYTTYDADGEVIRSGLLVAPEDVFQPVTDDASKLLAVSSLDMSSDQGGLLSTQGVLAGNSTTVYASLDNLYVFSNDYDSADRRRSTDMLQFAWNGESGSVDFAATGQIPGWLNDQFSADEHDGKLRVATTVSNNYAGNFSGLDENTMFVLESDGGVLEPVGSLHNLALGEQIQSVRFAGEKALVVTFRTVDPIFGVDLSEATNPHVVGSLTLPGFSTYQQFIDDDHILTVGQNANGGLAATAISLFNISDLANPQLVDQADFPRGASTLAAADHHAFGWFSHHSMLSLPSARFYSVRVDADGDGYKETNDPRTEHDLFSYRVDVDAVDPLSLLGVVTEDSTIQRAAFVGDVLYTIAEDSIQSSHVNDPASLIQRVDWELQPVEGPIWLPIYDGLPEAMESRASAATTALAARLDVDESQVMHVTSEADGVVLRVGDDQYLYEAGSGDEVVLADDNFEFAAFTPTQNDVDALDVNNDGLITPLDAIITINTLNEPPQESVRALAADASEFFVDTDGSGSLTPLDALRVINRLNEMSSGGAVAAASQSTAATDFFFAQDDDEE